MAIISGLDWSGDFGNPSKKPDSGFVVAICSADRTDLPEIHHGLLRVRKSLGFAPDHVFHHKNTQPRHRDIFFDGIIQLPIYVTCLYVDLGSRSNLQDLGSTGGAKIRNAIVQTVLIMPNAWVAEGTLIMDLNRSEKGFVRSLKSELRSILKSESRKNFARVNARPDHRDDSGLVQIADMFAGRVNKTRGEFSWNSSPNLVVRKS